LYDTKNKKKEGIYKPNSSTGIFILIVPSGSYKIEIISEGYTTYTEEFKISEISQPPFLTKKIALKKIK
jgi:hypothetical protein